MSQPVEQFASGPPDWNAIQRDVECPLCEYNLRGLIESRCPECGYRFNWPELLDERRAKHPFLFEHHPERNIRSYVATVRGLWRPTQFWNALHPQQRSRPQRLLAYWFVGAILFVPAAAMADGLVAGLRSAIINADLRWTRANRASFAAWPNARPAADMLWPQADEFLDGVIEHFMSPRNLTGVVMLTACVFVWPFVTLVTLRIFRESMRRARLKPVHFRRCVLYSLDPAMCAMVLLLGAVLWSVMCMFPLGVHWGRSFWPQSVMVIYLIASIRMARAFQYYLRFDRPIATVAASQAIVGLMVANVLAYSVTGFRW